MQVDSNCSTNYLFVLELIHTDPSSPLLSVTIVFFLQLEKLCVFAVLIGESETITLLGGTVFSFKDVNLSVQDDKMNVKFLFLDWW